jgi:hypothetical protein
MMGWVRPRDMGLATTKGFSEEEAFDVRSEEEKEPVSKEEEE